MKKRTYVIGAAILLLAIIAGDYYLNEKHNYDANSGHWAHTGDLTKQTPPDTETGTTADNNANSVTTGAATITATNKPLQKHIRPIDDRILLAANAPGNTDEPGGVTVIMDGENEAPSIDVKTSKAFYGYKPQNIPPRKRFGLPNNLGIELGYNQSSFNGNHESIPIGNFHGGLLYNINFGEHFALQPGLMYVTKGNRYQSEVDAETGEKLSLHYLEVPANFIVKFGNPGNTRFMIGAGPYVSYLAGAQDRFHTASFYDGSDEVPATPAATPQYATNNINTFDWGFGGFIGIQSPEGLFAKVGGEAGMMDVMKNSDGTSNRNNNIMISVGYIIGGK